MTAEAKPDRAITLAVINKRRQTNVAYLLLSDEEIAQEILAEGARATQTALTVLAPAATNLPAPLASPADVTGLLTGWQNFYQDIFGMKVDFSNLHIPERRAGFDRLIVLAQGLTAQQVYDKCNEFFTCWKYTEDSLDETIPTNDRTAANGAYAVWVRERAEADQEHKNRSANWLKGKNTQCITLLERLLYELKYFKETNKHLDINNWTLCAGSRYSRGDVPYVYWYSSYDKLYVYWYYPDDAVDFLRAREVVS